MRLTAIALVICFFFAPLQAATQTRTHTVKVKKNKVNGRRGKQKVKVRHGVN